MRRDARAAHVRLQRRLYPLHHIAPLPPATLAEQPHSRIPRAVFTAFEPAPIRDFWQHEPNRFTQCARQMGYRCVDAQNQIELTDRGGRVTYIVQFGAQIDQVEAGWRRLGLLLTRTFLEAIESRPGKPA